MYLNKYIDNIIIYGILFKKIFEYICKIYSKIISIHVLFTGINSCKMVTLLKWNKLHIFLVRFIINLV